MSSWIERHDRERSRLSGVSSKEQATRASRGRDAFCVGSCVGFRDDSRPSVPCAKAASLLNRNVFRALTRERSACDGQSFAERRARISAPKPCYFLPLFETWTITI